MDNMEPTHMSYKLLSEITDDFSDERILGRGTFGVVYKGEDKDARVIAVKILKFFPGVKDDDFHREFDNLAKLRHKNIVQLLGFCNQTENVFVEYNGKQVPAVKVHRALCFEYMQNGSLQNHLFDADHGFGWNKRYRIIKGVCEGLKYLHMKPVYHLDLKPDNILLDDNMVPKIADFGLSRLLGDENTTKETIGAVGTRGYLPPEYVNYQIISKEFDIFSLGVIVIKIMIGSAGYFLISDMERDKFIEHVCNKWRERLQVTGRRYTLLILQVKRCIEIALECIETDKNKRPTIGSIVEQLNEMERSPSWMEESDDSESVPPNINNLATRYQAASNRQERPLASLLSTLPTNLPAQFLKDITDGFSDARKLGQGAYGTVYKGFLQDGQPIAVKKLADNAPLAPEQQFKIGVANLMAMQHPNLVRLLGYCCEPQKKVIEHSGRHVLVDVVESLLCYEYAPNGSLDKYISDASSRPDWKTCFEIIKGICQGLRYLHKEMDRPIVHLDLHPTNILLDENMVPKITDFGLSRLFGEEQTRINTADVVGKNGYMAPEYLYRGEISTRADIYSLGVVIMDITIGEKNLSGHKDLAGRDFIDKVRETWTDKQHIAFKHPSLDTGSLQQVRTCIEIALKCVDIDQNKRPSIVEIVDKLDGRSSFDWMESKTMELNIQEDVVARSEEPSRLENIELNILEHVVAGSKEPSHLDLSLLQSITENFSEPKKIGVGGCGEVYKGILRNGIVAVKRLFKNRTIKDKMFHREVQSLITVKHENIIRFLGYCSFTEERVFTFEGKTIMADIRERLLCFEYISNGSLENHITDELRGLEWHTRYEIIVGICKGLLYLHKEKDIVHMDLKPANILLDDHMVPKITDFGLSRFDNNSHTMTSSRFISLGYCAPEYISKGKSSSKSDIYSLGVIIIELATGTKDKPDLTKVLRRWRHRWIKSSKHTPLGYQQVTKCLELAQTCTQDDPTRRPDIVHITHELNAMNSKDDQFQEIPCLDNMLGVEPLEIHFPFELDPQISHSIELTNNTDDYIAFMTKATLCCFGIEPDKGIVPPQSKCNVTIKMQAQVKEHELPNNHYKEKIAVQSTIVDGGLAAMDITRDVFIEKEGTVVDEVNVMVVFEKPPLAEES